MSIITQSNGYLGLSYVVIDGTRIDPNTGLETVINPRRYYLKSAAEADLKARQAALTN